MHHVLNDTIIENNYEGLVDIDIDFDFVVLLVDVEGGSE